MRKLLVALSLGCLLTVPAIATDWNAELDELARGWDQREAPQSEWRDEGDAPYVRQHPVEPVPAFTHAGDGWAMLDGWMRGDPLLRHWVVQRFDTNRDTWLSVPEATMARHAFYSFADANRSGIITSEEFVNGWGTVRAAMFGGYAFAG